MFITVDDGQRIFFDVVGSKLSIDGSRMREKPTLIVMHGGPGFDHSGFRPDFDAFADMAQVIYIDHRGNGRSQPSDPKTWTLDRWGDDVRNFCDALGIEKPIVLGQSFGGMVAQSYATRHPSHPGALILSSTAARMDLPASLKLFEDKGGAEARAVAERFWSSGTDGEFDTYMQVCMPLYNTQPRAGGADAQARAVMRREVYRHFSLPGCEIHRMDFRAALKRVACPTLVLAGAEDPITPPHLAKEIVQSIGDKRMTLRIYDRCGHGAFRDEPALVLGDIRAFIAGL
ncbi:MAG: alpha/beta fold hydrolase [Alphaproteobacteria bacterium]|nr:alpha/beta fold hydrolase [Alphaproteobacteria bacterium]